MYLRFFLAVILLIPTLISCTQSGVPFSENEISSHRFILSAPDQNHLEGLVSKDSNVILIKKMKFGGIVVTGGETRIKEIATKAKGSYEIDIVFSLAPEVSGKGSGSPQPQPVQTIPWGVSKIGARDVLSRGAGVTVCVSDTGIELTHLDLAENIIGNFNAITPTKTANDDNGHGTHVAGIISALDNTIGVVGVAPEAKLLAAKGLSKNGFGFSSDLAETIDWCREQGAEVINMSWGSSSSNVTIHSAIQRAYDAGIFLIAAAGNSSGAVSYPAAHPEVVAVSAVDISDTFAPFSNFGVDIENSAPGVGILSTYKGGIYKSLSGTSMASPHVAGVAALLLSSDPLATRGGLRGVDLNISLEQQGSRGRIDAILSLSP